ncbi:MAG: hypothetical protein LBK25_07970 [Treponema sp.]|nr:hypothetical protein [Treponema sp.]
MCLKRLALLRLRGGFGVRHARYEVISPTSGVRHIPLGFRYQTYTVTKSSPRLQVSDTLVKQSSNRLQCQTPR